MRDPTDTELVARGGTLALSGLIDVDVLALFIERLAELAPEDRPVTLDLGGAKLEHDRLAERLGRAIKDVALRLGSVRVIGAPSAVRAVLASTPEVDLGALDPA